jgi:hypothetical protein
VDSMASDRRSLGSLKIGMLPVVTLTPWPRGTFVGDVVVSCCCCCCGGGGGAGAHPAGTQVLGAGPIGFTYMSGRRMPLSH